jgi:tRNA-2-methylthio-N6-dimethylallyladenosine synthase
MKKYLISTWGCQMNVHDSEKMAGILAAEGYAPKHSPAGCGLHLQSYQTLSKQDA